jgi:hypothetical protein
MAPASEEVNHAALLADIKATLYEVGKSDLRMFQSGMRSSRCCMPQAGTGCTIQASFSY